MRCHTGFACSMPGDRFLCCRAIRHAGRVGVAFELHIAAEQHPAQLPACAMLVDPADDFLAETDGESLDLDATPACHEEVPELVHEDDDAEHDDERDEIEKAAGSKSS